jgi:hypothetical protein
MGCTVPSGDLVWGYLEYLKWDWAQVSGGPRPQNAVPVEIEMNGVTLLMTDRQKGAVNLSEVYNLHLTGLSLMYAQEALPYTQVKLTTPQLLHTLSVHPVPL